MYWRKPVRERYALLRQRHKGDLEYEYLYPRSLLGSNSAEALRLFKAILEKDLCECLGHMVRALP